MYAFRKSFTVGLFDGVNGFGFGFDYKIALILPQVSGYACSKMIGISAISALLEQHQQLMMLVLVAVSEIPLLEFPIVEPPYNFVGLL
jgi:uncharacterized membrane protein